MSDDMATCIIHPDSLQSRTRHAAMVWNWNVLFLLSVVCLSFAADECGAWWTGESGSIALGCLGYDERHVMGVATLSLCSVRKLG